jgi:GH24 family phage-related lysozyme (muramidase)
MSILKSLIASILRWIKSFKMAPSGCVVPSGTQTGPVVPGRNINPAGLALIKSFESCSLSAYQDQGKIWTIGWGHTALVHSGMMITQEQADAWLLEDLDQTIRVLDRKLPNTINSNQFSACVSLAYNVGTGNFDTSTLFKCLQSNDLTGASEQFLVWNKVNSIPNDGLLRRRKAEQALFDTK